ncbi:discoidin domain-containing protein [Streptomyces violascens]|uniref:discoidin domain-containing protein n=1 Tax=Streptomyces violascens TaxID=67381 RepID=UPI00369ADB73
MLAAILATGLFMIGWPALSASAAGGPDLAAGKSASASGANGACVAKNVTDGDRSTYGGSAGSAFPQSTTVDLGAVRSVDHLVLKLPPATARDARTGTLSVLDSTDNGAYGQLVASRGYAFDLATGNHVTIALPAHAGTRYPRLTATADTGRPAAQVSEFEAYGS